MPKQIRVLILTGLVALGLAVALGAATSAPGQAAPPAGFQTQTLILNLNEPTGLTFLPDGRMLILERGGLIRVVQPGAFQADATPFLQITNINIDQGERGLVGLTLDPNFAVNGYFYVFYTANSPLRDRLARFTASGNSAALASEVVIWQDPNEAGLWHHGGTLAFGPDGRLYVSIGDNFDQTAGEGHVSQRLDSPRGKILRLNADGTIPADNPFYDGAGPNTDEVWALGLRNPFRFSFDAQTGVMYIADVGGNNPDSIEELNRGVAGANYGWPLCEGACATPGVTSPIYSYPHNNRDASITGGFVYRGAAFPAEYVGSYFFGDYAQNWIRRLTFDNTGAVTSMVAFEPADGGVDGPYGEIVDLKLGPEGALYYVDIGPLGTGNAGTIRRIRPTAGNQPPVVVTATAAPVSGPGPMLTVNFSATITDADLDPLTYTWLFGDDVTAVTLTATHTYTQEGRYFARLAISDTINVTLSDPFTITVGTPPTATILSPASGLFFQAGQQIVITGAGGEDGQPLPVDNLAWTVVFHHNDHLHPAEGPFAGTDTFTFTTPITGHEFTGNTRFEVILTATDATGLSTSASIWLYPQKVNLRLRTAPAGLRLNFDEQTLLATPLVRDTLIGFQHTLGAPLTQTVGLASYDFVGWSDSGGAVHPITVPLTDTTYVATYAVVPGSVFVTYLPLLVR